MLRKVISSTILILSITQNGFAQYWSSPITVSNTLPDANLNCYLTMNNNGDALIVWLNGDQLYSSELPNGSTTWTSELSISLSSYGTSFTSPKTSLDDNGNAAIVLTSQSPEQFVFLYKASGDTWVALTPQPTNATSVAYNIGFANGSACALTIPTFSDQTFQMNLTTFNNQFPLSRTINMIETFNYFVNGVGQVQYIGTSNNSKFAQAARISSYISAVLPTFSGLTLTSDPQLSRSSFGQIVATWKDQGYVFGAKAVFPYGLQNLSIWTLQADSASLTTNAQSIGMNPYTNFTTALWSEVSSVNSTYSLYSNSLQPDSSTWTSAELLLSPTTDTISDVSLIVDNSDNSVAVWLDQQTSTVSYSVNSGSGWSASAVLATGSQKPMIASSSNGTNGYNIAAWVESGRIASSTHFVYVRPTPPSNFSGTFSIVQSGSYSVTDNLSWDASELATSYKIYSDSQLTHLIGTTSGLSFQINNVDISNQFSNYYLVAYDASNNASNSVSCVIKYPQINVQ